MKIFKNEGVYVHKKDLNFIIDSKTEYPKFLNISYYRCKTKKEEYDVVCFDQVDQIEYFQEQDWILDYAEVRILSKEELKDLEKEVIEDIPNIHEADYKALSGETKQDNIINYCDNLDKKLNKLKYKLDSIRLLIKNKELELRKNDKNIITRTINLINRKQFPRL